MVVRAKVCELTDGFLWFVCGNFDVSPKHMYMYLTFICMRPDSSAVLFDVKLTNMSLVSSLFTSLNLHICLHLANRAPGNEVCIAGAVPVCSLLAFDLLATFAGDLLDDISQVCQ